MSWNWYKIRYNKKSSEELGWDPSWFGENDFDDNLIDSIVQFQINHDLKPDGLIGTNTYRRAVLKYEMIQDSLEGYSNLVISGKLKPIAWHKVKRDMLPSKCFKTYRKERKPLVKECWRKEISQRTL